MKKNIICLGLYLLTHLVWAQEIPKQSVYPVSEAVYTQSLNGDWDFKYISGEKLPDSDAKFFEREFSASNWGKIKVPGHWEISGKAPLRYGWEIVAGLGLYRTEFSVPKNWEGKHIFIRFEGVIYGYKLYVNGQYVGAWNSSYNPCNFEVTPYLQKDKSNVLALEVTTRSKGWEFDTNDCWGLSGISRDVTLFCVPEQHFKDMVFRSKVKNDSQALLSFDLDVSHFGAGFEEGSLVQMTLFDQAMRDVCSFSESITQDKTSYHFEKEISSANLWTAETPYLYTLTAKILDKNGRVVQQIKERVGIREISIKDGVFLLNNKPILLHGICTFELDMRLGRALTDHERLKDLLMMKAANINFIRFASYPPHPRFLEMCDELGFYVDCEVPFGFGDQHLTNPDYQPELFKRAEATLTRDKNHPSIIFWTVGNENPFTELVKNTIAYVKEKDPTRPASIPMARTDFLENWEKFSDYVDLYCLHYPTPELLEKMAGILKKPIVLTEHSHSLGLAFEHLEAIFNVMLKHKNIVGGSVWQWVDQGLIKPRSKAQFESETMLKGVWKDEQTYYDSNGEHGTDGMLYADRYPSEDYWYLRKVYSPLVIHNKNIDIKEGANKISLDIENRLDFIPLNGYRIKWNLTNCGKIIESGEIYPSTLARGRSQAGLELNIPPMDIKEFLLELTCFSPAGIQISEKTVRLLLPDNQSFLEKYSTMPPLAQKVENADGFLSVAAPQGVWTLSADGKLGLKNAAGDVLLEAYPSLRVGRKPTLKIVNQASRRQAVFSNNLFKADLATEKPKDKKKDVYYWNPYLIAAKQISRRQENTKDGVCVEVEYRWQRAEKEGEYVQGFVSYTFMANGLLKISYDLKPHNASGVFLELGLGFELSKSFDTFRWFGEGPFASTPGKTAFNEIGLWAMHKDDLRFTGNRSPIDIALFARQNSSDILGYFGKGNQLGVENIDGKIVLTDNCHVTGYGTKITHPGANEIPANQMGALKSTFYLVPASITSSIFGKVFDSSKTIVPEIPFAKSYGY